MGELIFLTFIILMIFVPGFAGKLIAIIILLFIILILLGFLFRD